MAVMPTLTDPESLTEEIQRFLQSLDQHPEGPNICSLPISFSNTKQKAGWLERFPQFEYNLTYSRLFLETSRKADTKNSLEFFLRPMELWVGVPKPETTWPHAPFHAFAIAWIQKPGVTSGKDLVVYDLENFIPKGEDKLMVTSSYLVRGFIEWCQNSKPKKKINTIWYWQRNDHRGKEECLEHSFEWMKKLTLLGDQALSEINWETQGF